MVYVAYLYVGRERLTQKQHELTLRSRLVVQVLPEGQHGITVVAESCGSNNTFIINGAEVEFLGDGDRHDAKYDSMQVRADFINFDSVVEEAVDHCHHSVYIFPTDALKATYETKKPLHYAMIIASIFIFAAMVFVVYDWFVTNRQNNTERKATKSNAIVQELFPGNVAAKLFDTEQIGAYANSSLGNAKTIAELYPAATVLCKSLLATVSRRL